MKERARRRSARAVGVALLCVLWAAPGPARAAASPQLGEGSALWIEGKSNVHDFESRTAAVEVKVEWGDSSAPATAAEALRWIHDGSIRRVEVEVPVRTLKSSKGGLDKNLWQDLRADEHPRIRFEVTAGALRAGRAGGDTVEVLADGVLRVAGRDVPVRIEARAWASEAGLWIEGSKGLRMTEFGIKPRTMMLGTLRVRDEVVVRWRLLLTVPWKQG